MNGYSFALLRHGSPVNLRTLENNRTVIFRSSPQDVYAKAWAAQQEGERLAECKYLHYPNLFLHIFNSTGRTVEITDLRKKDNPTDLLAESMMVHSQTQGWMRYGGIR
jgi:hypothetical protein